ncbi:MAG: HAD family hydrolase [Promethearchaeota archaeon]
MDTIIIDENNQIDQLDLKKLFAEKAIKAILFDMDGTITDTLKYHIEAFKQTLELMGINVKNDKIKEIENNLGRTPKDILRTLIFENKNPKDMTEQELEKLEKYAGIKTEKFNQLIPKHPKVLPGALNLLKKLKERGYKLGLISSTPIRNVKKILERANLLEYLDQLVTAEDILIGKPDPAPFLKGSKKLGIPVLNCAVIGDSPHDLESAHRGGFQLIIATLTGKHSRNLIIKKKPMIIVKNLKYLLNSLF